MEIPGVLRLLLIPLGLTAVLDGLAFHYCFGWLHQRIVSHVPDRGDGRIVRAVLDFLSGGLVVLLLAWTFSFVYLLLCELVVDSVSEAVEERVTGHHGSAQSLGSRLRGVWLGLLQTAILGGLGLGSFLLGFIPVAGPVLTLLFSALSLGYGFFAISAGRKVRTLGERWQLLRTERGAVMGLGLVACFLNFVPVVNLLALPVFVVAGTLLYLDTTTPSLRDAV
jgi:uncharacterized protein involved in cysteine biosynthesis